MSDQVMVTVSDDHLDGIDALTDRLRGAGMRVDQVLTSLGVITGTVASERRAAIAEVPGVAAVEATTTFQLPPPDQNTQ
jgi:hypothetical protein